MLNINFDENVKYTFNGNQLKFLLNLYNRYAINKYQYQETFNGFLKCKCFENVEERNIDVERDVLETVNWEYEEKLEKYCRERITNE